MKLRPGDRVVHERHGEGDVIDATDVSVRIEFADGTQRNLLLCWAPLKHLDGTPVTTPTTAKPASPVAIPTQATAMPTPTTSADLLLGDLNALAGRPRGAFRDLAKHLGINPCSLHGWRRDGSIPESRRPAVRAWIDALPPLEAKTAPAQPKPSQAPKPAKETKPTAAQRRRPVVQPARLYTRTYSLSNKPAPAPAEAIAAVLPLLGLTITDAWIPDGTTMRQVRVAVLP